MPQATQRNRIGRAPTTSMPTLASSGRRNRRGLMLCDFASNASSTAKMFSIDANQESIYRGNVTSVCQRCRKPRRIRRRHRQPPTPMQTKPDAGAGLSAAPALRLRLRPWTVRAPVGAAHAGSWPKVLLRSVATLGVYRNEGSRIDFMQPPRVCYRRSTPQ